jgi:hypothetical protein
MMMVDIKSEHGGSLQLYIYFPNACPRRGSMTT